MNARGKFVLGVVVLLAVVTVLTMTWSQSNVPIARAQSASGGPIHGYVAAALTSEVQIGAAARAAVNSGTTFNVSDISVVAKNLKTSVISAPVKTNPEGYFRTDSLPPGEYLVCVDGVGYTSSCDPKPVRILSSIEVLDHIVEIRPASGFVAGTVRLADQLTPCFWFRPAFDTNTVITAKVSLLNSGGTVVAGPVSGNSVGQYVLPVPQGTTGTRLEAVCEGSTGGVRLRFDGGAQMEDIVIHNNAPQIVSFDLSKGGVGVRRADPGDVLHASVEATDLDGDPLHYRWTDDSGRSLGLPDSPTVDWPLLGSAYVNTLHVQVSDGKGGFTVGRRDLRAGANLLFFEGTLLDRLTRSPISGAQISLNNVAAVSNSSGHFQVSVPDAPRFVLNVSKPGFAFASQVLYGIATGIQISLDATQTATVNGATGGPVLAPPGDCDCACDKRRDRDDDKDDRRQSHAEDKDKDKDKDVRRRGGWDDRDKDDRDRDDRHKHCKHPGQLALQFPAHALVDANGNPFNGTARVEMFQYDTSLPNPIPGDQGAISQGKTVRLATFGAFYLQPRDAAGKALRMAPNKKVHVSMPIEATVLAKAPATIPFFRYEETTGLWSEHGTLTRQGNNYVGDVDHFSVFNADTIFPNSSCVKVIIDNSFPTDVILDALYVEPGSGAFNHNGQFTSDRVVAIERMTPNVNFTLTVSDASHNPLRSVTLNSGAPLPAAQFPDGLDTDPNFGHCNGPVTVYNNIALPTGPTYLEAVTGGSIQDNSVAYRTNTNADPGGSRDTLPHWFTANGFPATGEAKAIYFNNGDLKFGRDMHCRFKSSPAGAIACYVSNYGAVGQDDSVLALANARSATALQATVAMEYDPTATGHEVQFWAYDGSNNYLAKPALDSQGPKPMPEMCQACHGGHFDNTTKTASKAAFLPFDLDSFLYDTAGDPHTSAAVQEQFRQLNNIVLSTHPDTLTGDTNAPITQLMALWYPAGVGTANAQYSFGHAVAANQGGFPGHGPLYDNVVKTVCRTCHVTRSAGDDWTAFTQMNPPTIKLYACGAGNPHTLQYPNYFAMPHAEVPFKNFWLNSLSSTLDSELSLGGCPNN